MKSKTTQMVMALSAFQLASTTLSSEAEALTIKNGLVKAGTTQTCKLDKFLTVKAINSIKGNKKYSNNPQVVETDDVATIIKKINHQYTDINQVLSNGLGSDGYYDEYPHKLSDYFTAGACTQSW